MKRKLKELRHWLWLKSLRWDCIFGKHTWLYDGPGCNHARCCTRCRQWEEYTLVDFGRSKMWLKVNIKKPEMHQTDSKHE